MKCPKCGAEMQRVGVEQISPQGELFEEYSCINCGYRIQQKRKLYID